MKKNMLSILCLAACLWACGGDNEPAAPGGGNKPGGGESGGVTEVVTVTSDLTVDLRTDKACYKPGETVTFTAEGTLPVGAKVR